MSVQRYMDCIRTVYRLRGVNEWQSHPFPCVGCLSRVRAGSALALYVLYMALYIYMNCVRATPKLYAASTFIYRLYSNNYMKLVWVVCKFSLSIWTAHTLYVGCGG